MLSLVTIPKPFDGHIGIIQRNAIESWRRLRPECEIILLGDDAGTADVARELGLQHVPKIARNEFGTPLVSDIFRQAQLAARRPIVCYVNADIILFPDFLDAVRRVACRRFLMIGRRTDLDVREPIDFTAADWERVLRERARREGYLQLHTAVDYFVFPRGFYEDVPPFAVGRAVWDHWLVFSARSRGVPVFDASRVVTVIHQNHGYQHYQGGKVGNDWFGPEHERNNYLGRMVGPYIHPFTILDATHIITPTDVRPATEREYLWRRLMAETVIRRPLQPVYRLAKSARERRKRLAARRVTPGRG